MTRPDQLFGADGIRGRVASPIFSSPSLERLGQAIATWLHDHNRNPIVLVASDTRESSQRIKANLVDSLNRSGIHTVDAKVLPTAAVSYFCAQRGIYSGGMMISASHGPIVENGIKIFDHGGVKLSEKAEEEIERSNASQRTLPPFLSQGRNHTVESYVDEYAHEMASEFRDIDWTGLRLLVDCANGAAYRTIPKVFEKLRLKYDLVNARPDGLNINFQAGSEYIRHHPKKVLPVMERYQNQLAVALDGDADRVVLVDRFGRFYDGDLILAILALKLRRMGQLYGNKVVITQMSNAGLREYMGHCRIAVGQVRNGDKYITQMLLDENLALGGEQVGHLVIRNHPARLTGDGIRTALTVLQELVDQHAYALHELIPGMRKWPQIVVSVHLHERTILLPHQIPELEDARLEIIHRTPDLHSFECRPASTESSYRIMMEARFTQVEELAVLALKLVRILRNRFKCHDLPVQIFDCVNGGEIVHDLH